MLISKTVSGGHTGAERGALGTADECRKAIREVVVSEDGTVRSMQYGNTPRFAE